MNSLPDRVTLELTNRCNRTCMGCPRTKMTYPLGDMDFNLYKKILGQLPDDTVIVPFFRGESTLHPRFIEMMGLLKRFPEVQFATNGDTFQYGFRDGRNAMMEACSFISFSLHCFGFPEDFDHIVDLCYVAVGWDAVTQISVLETQIPIGEKKRFVDEWLKYADRVRIYVEHSKKSFGDVDEKYKLIDSDGECHKPFSDIVVYWDGKVVLCNHDWDRCDCLGDLNVQTMGDMWNGLKYWDVREKHLSGRRREVESCENCDYWMINYLSNKMFGELYVA